MIKMADYLAQVFACKDTGEAFWTIPGQGLEI